MRKDSHDSGWLDSLGGSCKEQLMRAHRLRLIFANRILRTAFILAILLLLILFFTVTEVDGGFIMEAGV
jgi:hypothetical protein